jgi:hypothetical protein
VPGLEPNAFGSAAGPALSGAAAASRAASAPLVSTGVIDVPLAPRPQSELPTASSHPAGSVASAPASNGSSSAPLGNLPQSAMPGGPAAGAASPLAGKPAAVGAGGIPATVAEGSRPLSAAGFAPNGSAPAVAGTVVDGSRLVPGGAAPDLSRPPVSGAAADASRASVGSSTRDASPAMVVGTAPLDVPGSMPVQGAIMVPAGTGGSLSARPQGATPLSGTAVPVTAPVQAGPAPTNNRGAAAAGRPRDVASPAPVPSPTR